MSHDTLLTLSRWQWALTAAMHITFPALTVGTSVFMSVCYWMYMRTDEEVWLRMFRFWRRIFAIGFAIGVVSGIVLTFDPAGLPGPLVVEPDRVHVCPRREQSTEERHLHVLRRPVMDDSRRCLEEGSLRGARRGSLLRGEPQQLEQPGVLRPQPCQLGLNRRRYISHGHKLSPCSYPMRGIGKSR